MRLMLVYVILVIVGEVIAVNLGLFLDKALPALSLPIALALFFTVLVATGPLAVMVSNRFFPTAK
jgi:hypothetical protein